MRLTAGIFAGSTRNTSRAASQMIRYIAREGRRGRRYRPTTPRFTARRDPRSIPIYSAPLSRKTINKTMMQLFKTRLRNGAHPSVRSLRRIPAQRAACGGRRAARGRPPPAQ
ncbi:hypothetical protein EVAR_87239_1 [Eumeta japonica]|uniref:Uncharacterized protein n=1 Tax=Eumeta variegata TaxID=151549 RepID=A0A4C1YPM7_EUMVA|nr:hypothetical protein EVAR_87239_1 [Eumeta japonica]